MAQQSVELISASDHLIAVQGGHFGNNTASLDNAVKVRISGFRRACQFSVLPCPLSEVGRRPVFLRRGTPAPYFIVSSVSDPLGIVPGAVRAGGVDYGSADLAKGIHCGFDIFESDISASLEMRVNGVIAPDIHQYKGDLT